MANKEVKLTITSAIAIGGVIKRPGAEVTVSEEVAKNLLQRGRAELATNDDTDADATADGDDPKGAQTTAADKGANGKK